MKRHAVLVVFLLLVPSLAFAFTWSSAAEKTLEQMLDRAGKLSVLTTTPVLGPDLAPALIAGNWTVGAGWESPIVGPGLIKNADGLGTQTPSAATTIVIGTTYKVVLTLSADSVSGATYTLGGVQGIVSLTSVATFTDYITAATTGKLIISPILTTARFTISAISIQAVTLGTLTTGGLVTARNGFTADGTIKLQNAYLFQNTDPATANFSFGTTTPPVFTTGHDNFFLGLNSGDSVTTGVGNLGIGHSALGSMVSGTLNLAIGWDSQFVNISGTGNVTVGADAFKYVTGDQNLGLGFAAGYTTTSGSFNLAAGNNSLYLNTTGQYNVAIGHSAVYDNTTGNQNVGLGANAIRNVVTASNNIGIGYAAGYNTTGGNNTIIGNAAGFTGTTYANNVILGYLAGYYETGSNTLMIDNAARSNEADARVKALIYGIFAATVAAQSFTVNAGTVKLPGLAAGAATGKTVLCIDVTTGQLYASSSGVACAN